MPWDKERFRAHMKQKRINMLAVGLCICGSKLRDGVTTCEKCAAKNRRMMQNRVKRRLAASECRYCGTKVPKTTTWCDGCKAKQKRRRRQLKIDALAAYGGPICKCCGEIEFHFLCVDHIDGGGRQHRREIKTDMYEWLRKMRYPPGFQILCWNCNNGRQLNGGVCPHKVRVIERVS
jgi:hypothetical protein